jgi:ABC-type multidrug transport system ATPase subunit
LEHVTKRYGRRRVLDDANVTFARGSFTLLTGPNGAGKTTILRLLSTYSLPNAGTIHWVSDDGSELRDPAQVRARIGYVGHAPLAWDELSVRENVELQLRMRGRHRHEARQSLDRFGLAARSEDRADTLSRGMRQRLALAMATCHGPSFLLLDEPASNLDDASLQRLSELLHELRGRCTTVVATHDPAPLRALADRVVHVQDAKLEERGVQA